MSTVAGSYASVIGGVSAQTPHERREGQHWAQENFLSDPVVGLARRRGSINVDEKRLLDYADGSDEPTKADTRWFKSFNFSFDGKRHTLFYV